MRLENVEDIYPLTPMQQLMLMHSLRSRGSSTLVNQFRYRLSGTIDESRFVGAWEQVLERHDAMRTAFVWEDVPEPLQVVRTQVTVPLEFVDLRDKSDAARCARTDEILSADRARGFDLRRAPLLRLWVLHMQDEEHLLILSRHHLILDLWSAEIVFNEVFKAYESPECLVHEPAGRFRSYLEWLLQQDGARAETYWRQYLEGIEAPSLLFGSRARRAQWTEDGQSSVKRAVDGDVAADLAALARRLGLTTGTLLQGIVGLLVSVLTDKRDVIFGLTVSARSQQIADVEYIVGSFINNVPVRSRIDDDAPIRQWLEEFQVHQSKRAAFEHVSPVDLHRWSNIATDAALFDLLILMQPPLVSTTTIGTMTIEAVHGPMDSALPMTLAIELRPDGFTLTAVYEPSIVSGEVAEGIVEAVVAAIACTVQGLPERLGELRQRIAQNVPYRPFLDAPEGRPETSTQVVAGSSTGDASDPAAKMLDIFRRTIGNPDVGLDDDFFALGGTSIQAAIAFIEIEQQFGKAIPLATLFSAGSVRKLLQFLELPLATDSSLVSIQGFGDRPPIIAISGIGGHVLGLTDIARVLGQNQPLFGLQAKTFESGEQPPSTIEIIAKEFIAECEEVRRAPFVLFGICFGANVVIEMAHQLESRNEAPALVVVLDPSFNENDESPGLAIPRAPTIFGFVVERTRMLIDAYRATRGEERRLWLREKRDALIQKIRHRDLLHGSHLEFRQRRVEAANLAAARRYRPRPYAGEMRTMITQDRHIESSVDPRTKWLELMKCETSLVRIPGFDTGDALRNQASALAAQLRHWIDELVTEPADPS